MGGRCYLHKRNFPLHYELSFNFETFNFILITIADYILAKFF